jgi:hypothetical protein
MFGSTNQTWESSNIGEQRASPGFEISSFILKPDHTDSHRYILFQLRMEQKGPTNILCRTAVPMKQRREEQYPERRGDFDSAAQSRLDQGSVVYLSAEPHETYPTSRQCFELYTSGGGPQASFETWRLPFAVAMFFLHVFFPFISLISGGIHRYWCLLKARSVLMCTGGRVICQKVVLWLKNL